MYASSTNWLRLLSLVVSESVKSKVNLALVVSFNFASVTNLKKDVVNLLFESSVDPTSVSVRV